MDAVGVQADEWRVVVAEGVARGLSGGVDEECERQQQGKGNGMAAGDAAAGEQGQQRGGRQPGEGVPVATGDGARVFVPLVRREGVLGGGARGFCSGGGGLFRYLRVFAALTSAFPPRGTLLSGINSP